MTAPLTMTPLASRCMLADTAGVNTLRQLAVLDVVATAPGVGVRELARALSVPKPTITRAVDLLAEGGLMVRRVDPNDGRCVKLQVTAAGRKALAAAAEG